jgi:hypothetical protein
LWVSDQSHSNFAVVNRILGEFQALLVRNGYAPEMGMHAREALGTSTSPGRTSEDHLIPSRILPNRALARSTSCCNNLPANPRHDADVHRAAYMLHAASAVLAGAVGIVAFLYQSLQSRRSDKAPSLTSLFFV